MVLDVPAGDRPGCGPRTPGGRRGSPAGRLRRAPGGPAGSRPLISSKMQSSAGLTAGQRRATMLVMANDPSVPLTAGPPETVLPPPPPAAAAGLSAALATSGRGAARRRGGGGARPTRPSSTAGPSWPGLARDDVEAYAYARVGYHRGLDALRAAGWRGSGYVRWEHPDNRGFLRALDALRAAAAAIGEEPEAERCALFLRQLDPDWRGRSAVAGPPASLVRHGRRRRVWSGLFPTVPTPRPTTGFAGACCGACRAGCTSSAPGAPAGATS